MLVEDCIGSLKDGNSHLCQLTLRGYLGQAATCTPFLASASTR